MIRFRDLTCLLILLALSVYGLLSVSDFQLKRDEQIDISTFRSDSKRQMVVEIGEAWTSFQIPAGSKSVRIMSNVTIGIAPQSLDAKVETIAEEYRYAIEYQLLDEHSKVLQHDDYHFRSKLRRSLDRETGKVINPLRLADDNAAVAQTRIMEFELDSKLQGTRLIRIRTSQSDTKIERILARAAYKAYRRNHDRYGAWNSISGPRKEMLAQNSVYEHALLDPASRKALLKWEWLRAAPIGEFERKYLYEIQNAEDIAIFDSALCHDSVLHPGWKKVIPFFSKNLVLRVEAESVDDESPIDGNLQCRFIDSETRKIVQRNFPLTSPTRETSTSIHIENVSSLLEFSSDCSLSLSFSFRDGSKEGDAWQPFPTPSKSTVSYVADHQAVVFPISHFKNQVTPLKVNFRFPDPELLAHATDKIAKDGPRHIHWRYVDEDGITLTEGKREFLPIVSNHEHIWRNHSFHSVSDPTQLWFPVPPEAKKVEFWSESQPFLVNAYSRPTGLPAVTRIPEDYENLTGQSPIRRWFITRAENHEEYIREKRFVSIKVQPRLQLPDEEKPNEKIWNQFFPEGNWIATRLLTPVLPSKVTVQEKRIPDSKHLWREIIPNHRTPFKIVDRESTQKKIQIAFDSTSPTPTIRLWCEQQLLVDKQGISPRGQFSVQLPYSEGTIRLESNDGTRVFANGISTESSIAFWRRSATRLNNIATQFIYTKSTHDDELLSLCLFRDRSEQDRAQLSVNIVPNHETITPHEPQESWTILNRQFDLAPPSAESSILLDRYGSVDSGSKCFLKLGSDLPPGQYRIEVAREDSHDGYLMLYQSKDGEANVRKIGIHDISTAIQ